MKSQQPYAWHPAECTGTQISIDCHQMTITTEGTVIKSEAITDEAVTVKHEQSTHESSDRRAT